jgi:hypothetical protein
LRNPKYNRKLAKLFVARSNFWRNSTFMRQIKLLLVASFLLTRFGSSQAQGFSQAMRTFGLDLRNAPWVFGVHWHIVDDDGFAFKRIFKAKESWNIPPYPCRITVEKYYKKGFSFEFQAAFNQYKVGKLINSDKPLTAPGIFLSFDINGKFNFCELYDFNKLFGLGEKKIFDIYGIHGWGYTYRSTPRVGNAATFNIGFGFNAWVYENWGVQVQAMSKFGLDAPLFRTPKNYLNYSFGVVYKLKPAPMSLGKRYKFKKREIKPKI